MMFAIIFTFIAIIANCVYAEQDTLPVNESISALMSGTVCPFKETRVHNSSNCVDKLGCAWNTTYLDDKEDVLNGSCLSYTEMSDEELANAFLFVPPERRATAFDSVSRQDWRRACWAIRYLLSVDEFRSTLAPHGKSGAMQEAVWDICPEVPDESQGLTLDEAKVLTFTIVMPVLSATPMAPLILPLSFAMSVA